MKIELLWFSDCPNHEDARQLLKYALESHQMTEVIEDIDCSEAEVAVEKHFPGSPTIRVDGLDIEPGFIDPGDYTPRCRLYMTTIGLRPLPELRWLEQALGGHEQA